MRRLHWLSAAFVLATVAFLGTSSGTVWGAWAGSTQDVFGEPLPPLVAFADIPSGSPLLPVLSKLAERGIITGYPDGTFRPYVPLNRAEVAAILMRAVGAVPACIGAGFSDVAADAWYAGVISCAARAEVVHGYGDGSFRPERGINAAEAATMLMNTFTLVPPYVPEDAPWYAKAMMALRNRGVMSESMAPWHAVTREDMAYMLYRLLGVPARASVVELTGTSATLVPITSSGARMIVTSPAFSTGGVIPSVYTCDGEGKSPPLHIESIPAEAKSLALIVRDPDAPGGDYVHWVLWNIAPVLTDFPEDAVPDGVASGTTSSGSTVYVPPCPPSGKHRYIFTVYALSRVQDLPPETTAADLLNAMGDAIIGQGQLIGTYGKE